MPRPGAVKTAANSTSTTAAMKSPAPIETAVIRRRVIPRVRRLSRANAYAAKPPTATKKPMNDDLNELLHALEAKGREHAHADEGGTAGDLDPARRATEIIDQAEHGEWSRGEQDERDRCDTGLPTDAEPAGHTGEHHCAGDGAEQQGSVETHRRAITQRTAKHDHE